MESPYTRLPMEPKLNTGRAPLKAALGGGWTPPVSTFGLPLTKKIYLPSLQTNGLHLMAMALHLHLLLMLLDRRPLHLTVTVG